MSGRLENAAKTGDLSEAQRAISQRTMEIIAENPEAFSDEDLRILAEGMEAASEGSPTTQPTVESLRRAIEAKKRGEPIGPIIDKAVRDGQVTAPNSTPAEESSEAETDAEPATPAAPAKPEPLPIAEEYRKALEATPERERLFREMISHGDGLRLTDKMIERFLATVPGDLTAEETEALMDRIIAAEDATEDEIFAKLESAIKEVRAGAKASEGTPAGEGETALSDAPAVAIPPEEIPSAPTTPAEPREPSTGPTPSDPATNPDAKPAAGLTPAQMAKLKAFLAKNPTAGVLASPLAVANRKPGFVFTSLIGVGDGSGGSQLAGYVTMRVATVRSLNDFDVVMSPTVFYDAAGRRRGVWPPQEITTPITTPVAPK